MFTKREYNWVWFVLIFIIWLVSLLLINVFVDENNKGTFGDQFGAVNALFTGLSLAGIIITLRQQQEELSAQRREFMVNRAMTIVYKQIELVSNTISVIKYIIPNPMKRWDNTLNDELYTGLKAIKKCRQAISNENKVTSLNQFVTLIWPTVLSISNSVNLLNNIRDNEKMSDSDALVIFQAFKYNLDLELWVNLEYLFHLYNNDTSDQTEDIIKSLATIDKFSNDLLELESVINK